MSGLHYDAERQTYELRGPDFLWLHDPAFCISGAIFAQPVQEGALQAGFFHSECGALDAPAYICLGGARSLVSPSSRGGQHVSVIAMDMREYMAARAEPQLDHFECWGADIEEYAL